MKKPPPTEADGGTAGTPSDLPPANVQTDGVTFSVKVGNKLSVSTKNACYLFLVIPIG